MEKYLIDFSVAENLRLNGHFVLLRLVAPAELPDMLPGQFAEVRIDDEPGVLLRRPISINYVDAKRREIGLLIQMVGKGTSRLARLDKGDTAQPPAAAWQWLHHPPRK
jgi:dihydroorotate dehydrogenase electron transfer subunit